MRVYEFSKQSGIPTRELLELLRSAGFEVSSHMAVLTDKEVTFLQNHFKSPPKATVPEKSESAKVEPVAIEKKSVVSSPKPHLFKFKEEPASRNHVEAEKREAKAPVVVYIEQMTVGRAAQELNKPVTDIILTLLKWAVVANKNQMLSEEVVKRLASHYEVPVAYREKKEEDLVRETVVDRGNAQERYPVVVVVGHVDHGKTTLLDYIRKTRVASREKGGITQHLGAYEASTPQGNVVFIDTPGHEAFSKMRMRGVRVADIVILVVAADDGVMPQTIEALKHAKSMEVPIIVAINKVDKVEAPRIEQVKQELSRHDLLAEDWGGNVIVVPLSAKTGKGVDQLLEMIILQAQMMELRADPVGPAQGYILESKLEKGRGPVATFLAQQGKISVGDYFVCATTVGRVSSLMDSRGARVSGAGPSIPVLIAGFAELPQAGEYCAVVSREEYLNARSLKEQRLAPVGRSVAKEGVINLVIKTDSNSSKEALLGAIHKLSKNFEKQFNIISAGIGDLSESDITLAATTGSLVFGLHIKPGPNSLSLAQKQNVTIENFDIIYKLLERLEQIAEGAKEVKMVRQKIGEAAVRKVFDIKGLGVIAGCYVKDGRFTRDGSVVIMRGSRKVGQGKIKSLQRDKKVVKEVHTGYECAFLVDGFEEFQIDDTIECYIEVPDTKK